MANRFLQVIGVASIINVGLVATSVVHRHLDSSYSVDEAAIQVPTIEFVSASEGPDSSKQENQLADLAGYQALASPSPPPDFALINEAPSIQSIQVQPPCKDDLLMAELRKQAAESIPPSLAVDPVPLVSQTSTGESNPTITSSVGKFDDPKSILKAKFQALRELSAAADDLVDLQQLFLQEGNDPQAKEVSAQIESLNILMRDLLKP